MTGVGNYILQVAKNPRELDAENNYRYFYGWYSRKLRFCDNPKKVYDITRKIPVLREAAKTTKTISWPS